MDKTFNYNFTPRISSAPIQRAISFLLMLDEIVEEHKPAGPKTPGLLDVFAQPLLDGDANPELAFAALRELLVLNESAGFSLTRKKSEQLFMAIVIAALHPAIAALLANSDDEAYEYLIDAAKMEGLLHGYMLTGKRTLVQSELARKAGAAGKPEYKEKKRQLHEWYLANNSRLCKLSLERATSEAMKTGINVSFRTAQSYIKDFRTTN